MRAIYFLLPIIVLSGCASIVSGTNQSVAVDTSPTGAACTLTNDKGSWQVGETPESVTVKRSYSAMNVTCEKGKMRGSQSFQSSTKGMAFGNILVGGIIGAGVDLANGAAYDYPSNMYVKLRK